MQDRIASSSALVRCLFLGLAVLGLHLAPAAPPTRDFSTLRGANYVPSYARNDVQTWMDFDPAVIDRELGYAQKLGLNCVRVFLQVAVFERNPRQFLDQFETFLALCEKHQLQMMPVLFDSCFGAFPDLEGYREKDWMACPGQNRLGEADWPAMQAYVKRLVRAHRQDSRILLWDVMNEPYITSFNQPADKALIHRFLGQALDEVRACAPQQPLTVGFEFWPLAIDPAQYAQKVDVVAFHNYSAELKPAIAKAREGAQKLGKPVILNEVVGRPHQGFGLVMPIVREEKIGWCFWELMLGKTQFSREDPPYQGLIYPDGTCYDVTEVAQVMNVTPAEAAKAFPQRRWSEQQAWDWYKKQPWIAGFNYVPSTAANTTEFWSAETFDPATIDRELGWGAALGFNTCRVFVQYLVWKADPEGLKKRLDHFLTIADRHKLTTTLVLFDDCAFGDPPQTEPFLGKQRDPIPGMILPSWTPSPGYKALAEPAVWPSLEKYINDVVGTFGHDRRVLMWDLYNEPSKSLPLVEATFRWARAAAPEQPLTSSPFGGPADISHRQLELSDVISFHFYGNYQDLRGQIERYKNFRRPVINTEWMARLQGSRWGTDLPLFKEEGVGCYNWGLVNGRTQAQFAWYHPRGTPEPKVWFHDLFHQDGRPYDPAEHAVIRQVTADKTLDWAEIATASQPGRPRMYFGDPSRNGHPFAKDPSVIQLGDRYLLYYSMAPATNAAAPKGWAIGIAQSSDLKSWHKVSELLPEQPGEQNGIVNGKALVLDGKVHLFYNTYGNGAKDALCHATSSNGINFTRNPANPILHATGSWNSGRAIDCDAFLFNGKLHLIYATRDPSMKTQMLALAVADPSGDLGPSAWKPVGEGPLLKPELPWEKSCIEAPSVIRRGDTLYLFYGGGYNNDPQQIGVASSRDGLSWTRLAAEPLIPNGQPDDWNASETGHPGVFANDDGRTFLFVQGNKDHGRTWFISAYELAWDKHGPSVLWDSPVFPMKRPGPSPHAEHGIAYSAGWTCWTGRGPRGDALHYNNHPGATASIAFQGTGLELVHKVGPDCGIAEVFVDGKPASTPELDSFAAEVDWNHTNSIASGLAAGPHTALIRVTGKKHPQSSDGYIQIVDFE